MNNAEIKDAIFLQAVGAVDSGDIVMLQNLIHQHPRLVQQPLDRASGDYFQHPYLLYFVADNPIRVPVLPNNIVDVTRLLIREVKSLSPGNAPQQLNYTLALVISGRIPRECGVQIQMIDLLVDEGATPGSGWEALAHGNTDALRHIIQRGGHLTLPAAVVLEDVPGVQRLLSRVTNDEKLVAVQAAAFYGNAAMLKILLDAGAPFNDYAPKSSGFHTHSTPLHQAVCSANIDAVRLLVEAGANMQVADKVYGGTPLGWAAYMQNEESPDEETRYKYKAIEEYLRSAQS